MGWWIKFCIFGYGFVLSRNKISRDETSIGWRNIKIQTITFYNKFYLCNIYSNSYLLFIIFGHINMLDSISISFATLSSGGFVPTSTILNSVNSITLAIIMGGMIIAALPFAFHFGIFSKNVEATKEVKEILIFLIILTLFIFLFMLIEPSFTENDWLSSVFHIISASTTTGFQYLNLSHLSINGKILLIFEKLVNSKKFTSSHNNKHLYNRQQQHPVISATAIQFRKKIEQTFKSYYQEKILKSSNKQLRSSSNVPLDKYKFNILSDKAFKEALFVVLLYISFTMITALCIYYLGENKIIFIDAVFEAATTISNNGLTVGITTMDLNSISKLLLSFNMIMGRFEIIAILYIFISKLRK